MHQLQQTPVSFAAKGGRNEKDFLILTHSAEDDEKQCEISKV